MRHFRTYLLSTLLFLLAAGQGAWAARTEPMAFKGRTVTNGNVTMYTWLFQGLLGTASQNATDGNRQTFNNQTISFSKGRLTITGTLIFAVADAFTDVTTGSQVTLVFENTPYWFCDATVKTLSDSPVSGCSTSVSSDMRTVTVTIPSGKTFGNVYLDFVPNAPMSSNNTTLGIENEYPDDGVNCPEPTVVYSGTLLTRDVDYTVNYTHGSTWGNVTVTGIGDYYGSVSKNYNIHQPSLSDFTQLSDGSYEIASKNDLDMLAKYVNNGHHCQGNTFRQTAAIDYGATDAWNGNAAEYGETFTSIGCYGQSFRGTYDGGGFTISGIRIYKTGTEISISSSQGFVGYLGDGGTVKNVVLANTRIFAFSNTGGIVGYNNGTVEDCIVGSDVAVFHNQQAGNFGGVVGNNAGGTIRRCTSSATIRSQAGYTSIISGGIAGCMGGGTISNSIAVNATVYSNEDPGGAIVGSKTGGTLTANYYYNCNINNRHTNVGTGSGDESGAVSVHTVTPGSGVNATVSGDEPVVIGSQTCFAAGSTVTLTGSYNGTPPEGDTFAGFTIRYGGSGTIDLGTTGGSFQMPAADATVIHRFVTLEWAGSGTEDDPYVISLPTQLDLLARRVNEGNDYEGKFFVLDADITYGHGSADDENNFTPIGGIQDFKGTFDGQGHTVSGIRIYKDGSLSYDRYLGLFGAINGIVKNVFLSDARVSGCAAVGGIVGDMNARATVQNCHVDGTVSVNGLSSNTASAHSLSVNPYCGGIAGYFQSGTVEGCTSAAVVTGGSDITTYSGGIVGQIGTITSKLINCFSIGTNISSSDKCGAIVGFNTTLKVYNNYYYDCTVNGASEDIGCGRRRVTYDAGDISDGDGAVRTIALATRPAEIGAQIASYPGGLTVYEHGVCWEGTYYLRHDLEGTARTLTLAQGTKDGVSACWGTFYHGSMRYSLPEGAAAYTMDNYHRLYRLGDNGRVIPAGRAVVIISDRASITLMPDTGTEEITDHAPGGNILQGSGTAIPDGQSAYVLSVDANGAIGFRQYSGTDAIPANKAYYLQ